VSRLLVLPVALVALALAGPGASAQLPPILPEPPPPPDVTGPSLARAVATTFDTVEVQPSEPVDPASVQPEDFVLRMADGARAVSFAQATEDGSKIILQSPTPWAAGEAGVLRLSGPGAISDRSGNASGDPAEIRVGGAPGDFVAPVVTRLRLNPTRGVCWVVGPRCKRERTAIIFRSSEEGDTFATVFRGRKLIGERRFVGRAGGNFLRFDGKILGQRLRPGTYRMYVAVQDDVGNRLPLSEQPSRVFRVKRTSRR
jgi:hypothetical protein